MNLALFSEYLNDASWAQTLTTISARTIGDGPYTTQPLQTVDFDVGGSISKNITLINTGYEYSIFVKKGTISFIKLTLDTAYVVLDVQNKTVTAETNNTYYKVEEYNNDFIRVIGRVVIATAGSKLFKIEPVKDSTGTAITSIITGAVVYGPQVIEGVLESYRSYMPTRAGTMIRATKTGVFSDPTVWHTGVVPQDGDYVCSGPYRVTLDMNAICNLDATRTSFMAAGGTTFTQQSSYGFSVLANKDIKIIGCFTGSPVPSSSTYGQMMITHPTNFTMYGDIWGHPSDFLTTTTSANSIIRVNVSSTIADQTSNLEFRNIYTPIHNSTSYFWRIFYFTKSGSIHSNTINLTTKDVRAYNLGGLRYTLLINDDGTYTPGTDKIVWRLKGKLDFPGSYSYYANMSYIPLEMIVENKEFLNPAITSTDASTPNSYPVSSLIGLTQYFEQGILIDTMKIPSSKTSGRDFAFNLSNAIVNGDYSIIGRPMSTAMYVHGPLTIKGDLYAERGLNTTNTYSSGTSSYSYPINSVLQITSNTLNITVEGDFIFKDESGRTQLYSCTDTGSGQEALCLISYTSGTTSNKGIFRVMGDLKIIGWGVPVFKSSNSNSLAGKVWIGGNVDLSQAKSNYSTSSSSNYTVSIMYDTYYMSSPSELNTTNLRVDGDIISMPSQYRASSALIRSRVEDSYRAIDIRGTYYHNGRASLLEDCSVSRNTNDSIFINKVVIDDSGTNNIAPVVKSDYNVTVVGKITNTSSTNTSTGIPGRLRIIGKDNGTEAPSLKVSNSTTTHTVLSETVENSLDEKDVRFGVVFNQVKVGTLKVPPAATVLKDIPVGQGSGTLEVGGSGGTSIDYTSRFDSIDLDLEEIKDRNSIIISMVEDL